VVNPSGRGGFVLACEHASNAIPAALSNLGLTQDLLATHIAWDPGALAVAAEMARLLDSPLVASRVSRLVHDCNRPPEAPDAIAPRSEAVDIPGNAGLGERDRRERVARFYAPFRDALAACLDARADGARPPALLTIHSFTPVYAGVRRDVQLGVLHDADARLADALLATLAADSTLAVRRNEPYGPRDGVTHTLAAHALPRGLPNAMIEIRNDLIASADAQRAMAAWLSRCAAAALAATAATSRVN
jgi:predicted N-formylglutamate amidohydrolase